MQLLPVRIATLVKLAVLFYAVNLTFFTCRADYSLSNQLVQSTCGYLNKWVYPAWTSQVQPHLDLLEKEYHVFSAVESRVSQARGHIAAFDEQYEISYKLDQSWAKTRILAAEWFGDFYLTVTLFAAHQLARAQLYYEGSMAPISRYYVSQYKKSWSNSWNTFSTAAKINTGLAFRSFRRHSSRFYLVHVATYFDKVTGAITSNQHVAKALEFVHLLDAIAEIKRVYSILLDKSVEYTSKLQAKTDFLRSEIKNFNKIDELKKKWKGDTASIVEVVNEILEDVTSSVTHKKESKADTVSEKLVVADSSTEEVLSSNSSNESTDGLESDSEEEAVTITSTQTRTATVTLSKFESPSPAVEAEAETEGDAEVASVDSQDEEVTKFGEDSSSSQLDYELKYWQTKVDKTLDLAYNSLEGEMESFLTKILDDLKEKISANFTTLQQGTFERYKFMNELITAIDKDSEFIRENNQIIEEPEVDRQIMRDKIKEAYDVVESSMKDVESHLNTAHFEIMEKYFEVVQSTVDVLESFADTTILDFSNRLSGLLEILESNDDFQDELSWSAWKQFHKVKDLIFNIRDLIFEEAEEYKVNPRGQVKPKGLKEWDQYLDNINFHIKFLLTDNDEYLKLTRAKANIAYQLREGLTRELIAKAEAEAEAERQAEIERQAEAERQAAEAEKQAAEEAAAAAVAAEDEDLNIAPEDAPQVVLQDSEEIEEVETNPIQSEELEQSENAKNTVPEPIEVPVLDEIEEEIETIESPHVAEKQLAQVPHFEEDSIVEQLERSEEAPEELEAND